MLLNGCQHRVAVTASTFCCHTRAVLSARGFLMWHGHHTPSELPGTPKVGVVAFGCRCIHAANNHHHNNRCPTHASMPHYTCQAPRCSLAPHSHAHHHAGVCTTHAVHTAAHCSNNTSCSALLNANLVVIDACGSVPPDSALLGGAAPPSHAPTPPPCQL
jgi:hypothetical protein